LKRSSFVCFGGLIGLSIAYGASLGLKKLLPTAISPTCYRDRHHGVVHHRHCCGFHAGVARGTHEPGRRAPGGVTMRVAEIHESFLMAMSAIVAHKLRSALTLLGIVVGVFSIIVVMTPCG
jgi:hypothetical protein